MIQEAFFMFKRRLKGIKSIKTYLGNEKEICCQIIKNCFNGEFFQASAGNFACFYIRDFGMCINSLLTLGYKKEVESTLAFALKTYAEHGKITTTITKITTTSTKITTTITRTITKNGKCAQDKSIDGKYANDKSVSGKCADYFNIAPDSLAFLLYSLRIAKDKKITNNKALVLEYKQFLEKEIKRYFEIIVDKNTGLVRKGYFSSIKDHAIRNSSCYDNCMLAMISREADKLRLENSFKKFDYPALIKKHFWHENDKNNMKKGRYQKEGYFKDDLDNDIPTGDANVFPYWCGIFDCASEDKEMAKSSIKAIQENKLDQPFPLKYFSNANYGRFLFLPSLFARNYEGNTIWMHLGLCYLDVIAMADRKLFNIYLNQCLNKYKELIKTHKNFLEVYNADGTVYTTPFYLCDDSMLWCSKFLELVNHK
ncbi:hypothetical protein HY636_06475 [Candidatus Woesearchaeota archaeon]|nr:hypothetical protein [Candidatus Woesearchaeota archaeon]